MSISLILIVIGVICFVLDSFKVATPVNLFSLGWAFVVAGALLVGG
jgi:hypothetical protein